MDPQPTKEPCLPDENLKDKVLMFFEQSFFSVLFAFNLYSYGWCRIPKLQNRQFHLVEFSLI
jgi:hypothetical protein